MRRQLTEHDVRQIVREEIAKSNGELIEELRVPEPALAEDPRDALIAELRAWIAKHTWQTDDPSRGITSTISCRECGEPPFTHEPSCSVPRLLDGQEENDG